MWWLLLLQVQEVGMANMLLFQRAVIHFLTFHKACCGVYTRMIKCNFAEVPLVDTFSTLFVYFEDLKAYTDPLAIKLVLPNIAQIWGVKQNCMTLTSAHQTRYLPILVFHQGPNSSIQEEVENNDSGEDILQQLTTSKDKVIADAHCHVAQHHDAQ